MASDNNLKILFLLYRFYGYGGIERVSCTLADLFADVGHEVSVCSFRFPSANWDSAPSTRANIYYLPRANTSSNENFVFVKDLIRRLSIDVVVFHDCYQPMENLLTALPMDVARIVVEHNTPTIPLGWPISGKPRSVVQRISNAFRIWRAERWTRRRHLFLYDLSDRYVLLSNRYFGEMRWVARLRDARKLRAIPNVNTFARVLDKPSKEKSILFLGSLLRVKGVDYLLDAWESVCCEFPEWSLKIVGDGPLRSSLEGGLSRKGLPRVAFFGATTDVAPHLRTAAILAAPSRYEGFPMVLGEAMAHGTVPVCFDSYSALRDIVTDGEDGVIVPAFDVVAYANALRRLMSDEKLLRGMSEKALVSVERFSANRVLPMWEALFSEVMEEKRRAK